MANPKKRLSQFKSAHKRAEAALTRKFEEEYRYYIDEVRAITPELSSEDAVDIARSILRRVFREEFEELYLAEKRADGIAPTPADEEAKRVREENIAKVIELYDFGGGLSMAEIARRLGLSYHFVNSAIRDLGVVPRIGRRRKKDGGK